MLDVANYFVALPGDALLVDAILNVLSENKLKKRGKFIYLININQFYQPLEKYLQDNEWAYSVNTNFLNLKFVNSVTESFAGISEEMSKKNEK